MSITLTAALAITVQSQAIASWDASYTVFNGGSYNADGTPSMGGTIASRGITSASPSVNYSGYTAFSPSGENKWNWYPLGYWGGQYTGPGFTARIEGKFGVSSAGTYTFGTDSDDGSALYVDNELVVNSGGNHSPLYVWNYNVSLSAGTHTFRVDFLEDGTGASYLTAYLDPRLTAVPEPATCITGALALIPLGLAGIRNLRNRKRD